MHGWHKCGRWERNGLRCPFRARGFEDEHEELQDEDWEPDDPIDIPPPMVPLPGRRQRSMKERIRMQLEEFARLYAEPEVAEAIGERLPWPVEQPIPVTALREEGFDECYP